MNLKIASPGDVLGLSAVISGSCFEVSAETLEPSLVKVVCRMDFLDYLEHHSDAGLHAAKLLAEEYKSAFSEARRMALSGSASGKLASFLLDWGRVAACGKSEMRFTLTLTHDDLASFTATTRETVTRALGKFQRDKLHDQGQFDPHSFAGEIGSAGGLEIGPIWRLAGLLAGATVECWLFCGALFACEQERCNGNPCHIRIWSRLLMLLSAL
jgi:hypothetical protein